MSVLSHKFHGTVMVHSSSCSNKLFRTKKVGCCGSNILSAKLDNVFHLNEYGTTKLGECSLFVMINLKIFSNKPCMMMLVQSNETIGSLVIT